MEQKDIPVLLLTGYLGSGKTTLVNHILANKQGLRFAVIVNDIGEVNIDAELIERQGVVNSKNESLVALQNGCICCTLRTDLIDQLYELMKMQCFDYILIEASGICEPEPIAQTICQIPELGKGYTKYGICRMDAIVTVVDALRMRDEFASGEALNRKDLGEDDIEKLLIQQIEFCNLVLLNKASEVSDKERTRIREIIHTLQPKARIIECDYADVDLSLLVNTRMFSFQHVATSAGWIREINRSLEDIETEEKEHHHHHEEHEEHGHEGHGHHHHHHEEGEAEEYGISSFVYYRRKAFDMNKFDYLICNEWPRSVIRCKGVCYFADDRNMSYLFEQAGQQKLLSEAGQWYAAMDPTKLMLIMQQEPGLVSEWDEQYGDRMQKLVFIGQKMNREEITRMLDACLED